MSQAAQAIIRQLPGLSSDDLHGIAARAKALLGSGLASNAPEISTDEDLALTAVCEVLAKRGVEYPNIAVLKSMRGKSAFRDKLAGVMHFIRKAHPTKSGQNALLRLGFNLLYDDLVKWGMTVDARALINQVHRLPATYQRHFPGYAQAGLLRFVVDKR